MTTSTTRLLQKHLWIREAAIYVAAFFIFVLVVLNRSPNLLRPLSMNVRFGFTLIVPVLFLALYLSFRMGNWLGRIISLTVALSVFGLALAGVWASGHSQSTYISGLVPLYDAQTYYVDALRILAGGSVSEFSTARPLFSGMLATTLAIAGRNLTVAIILLTAINGLACFLAANSVQQIYGAVASSFLFLFLFLYYRYRTVGTVMSENLGFALGVLGAVILWKSIAVTSPRLAFYGLLLITLGLNARPGPLFVLPALLLWGGWYFRNSGEKFSWRFFLLGTLVEGSGFAASLLVKQFFGSSSGVPFSQFAYALYGLASGGNSWVYIFQIHPELREMTQPALTWTVYRLTLALVSQQPGLLLQGALHNWSTLFTDSWYNLFAYVSGENTTVNTITRLTLYALCLGGILKWIRSPGDPYNSLIVTANAGILLSVPFVPPTDAYGMRLYAAAIIFIGLLPVLGLTLLFEILKVQLASAANQTNTQIVVSYSMLLVAMTLAGPFLVRGIDSITPTTVTSCQADLDSINVIFDGGTAIHLLREKESQIDWMPKFHTGLFKRNIHGPPDGPFVNRLESVDPLSSFFYTLDYRSSQGVLVILPTALLPQVGSTVEMCGNWETDPKLESYHIFVAQSVMVKE